MSLPKITRLRRLQGSRINPITAASLTIAALHNGGAVYNRLDIAGAQSFVLPLATGKRGTYRFLTGITATGNKQWKCTGSDVMAGVGVVSGSTSGTFGTASNSNTLILNGSTTGGVIGSYVEFEDMKLGVWAVKVMAVGSGTAATPFSNT